MFKLADEIVERGIKPEYVLYRDLGITNKLYTLVDLAERTIEHHNFKTIPGQLSAVSENAKCVDSAFVALEKERDTLANIHGNIKRLDFDDKLIAKCATTRK